MAKKMIDIGNGKMIPITAEEIDGVHTIKVDGVVWVETENMVHAAVLFNMMADHITEYMTYQPK